MRAFPIVVVEFDDGSVSSQETSSLGAAREICVDLKTDRSILAVTVYDEAGKVDPWSWSREE